ncbi:hypothetical protein BDP27DRAFT_1265073, partial [Rhodocollybia butyracea]
MAAEALAHAYLFTEGSTTKGTPFAYNPLHDLESVWWLIVYMLFFNDDVASPSLQPQERQTSMNRLFHGRLHDNQRFAFLKTPELLRAAKAHLSPTFGPAFTIIESLSKTLTAAYEASEKTFPEIDPKSFLIHTEYLQSLLEVTLREPLKTIVLQHVKRRPQEPSKASEVNGTSVTSLKRKSNADKESTTKRSRTSQIVPHASTSQSTR